MDAVILAGGRGQRLAGYALPFHKPLIEVNGKPLIFHTLEYAHLAGAERMIIVASPSNHGIISSMFTNFDYVTIAVQDQPNGPGDAMLVGFEHVESDRVLALMSDNLMSPDRVEYMGRWSSFDGIGTQMLEPAAASRFTRISKVDGSVKFVESTEVEAHEINHDGLVQVWCGPIMCSKKRMTQVLRSAQANTPAGEELKIGPHLTKGLDRPMFFPTDAVDVGVPDTYMEVTR